MFFLYRVTSALAYTLAFRLTLIGQFEADIQEIMFLSPLIAIVLWTFLLNSTLVNFANFDRSERLKFFERYHGKIDWEGEKVLIRKNKLMWVEVGVMTFLFFTVFSHHAVFSGAFDLIAQIPFMPRVPDGLRPVLTTAIFFGVLYWLEIRTRLEARRFWLCPEGGRRKGSRLWESRETHKQKMFGSPRRIRKLLTSYVIILMGAKVTPIAVAIAYGFVLVGWALIKQAVIWAKGPALWIVLTLLFLLVFGLAIRKRFLFLHRLKRTCKECGFRMLDLKHPVLSVFRDLKGYTFAIEANGAVYYCRLIASVKRSNKMIFLPDGTASRNVTFHIPQPLLIGVGRFVQYHDRGNGDDREFARYERCFQYAFEAGEGKKILLLNPVPRRAVYENDGHKSELDNGSIIGENGEYTVYSGNAFLRFLKRESMKE